MNAKDRLELIREMFEQCNIPLLDKKGHDYSGDEDANANFKIIASRMKAEIDKYDVWQVFFEKHILAIYTWIKDRKVKSESLTERIVDASNYLFILYTLVCEDGIVGCDRTETKLDDKGISLWYRGRVINRGEKT